VILAITLGLPLYAVAALAFYRKMAYELDKPETSEADSRPQEEL
jgi:hypothetical protein